ncbi:O-methyltransferase [Lacihabitans sp. CS3-21]|uniref:O-methyltransferase n=1 Tax=Lacihabitans sp. CS3-21 TaxID=2487332 RepID=UPI0020CBA21F|nr:class I SAM-dependent methyltransferase [Lacihabitans sp. CS3-21]MCP9748767.1 methyltransferase domain-containing protein [Lacihabitans sp. CS3-21]
MESEIQNVPSSYYAIDVATKEMGFTMPSDILTCSLLKTLAGSKPNGKFLELGTGTGLSTAWILDGINEKSSLISIDNDPKLLEIAQKHLGNDTRLSLECVDGEVWVNQNLGQKFDYIFADTWHGKYLMLDEVLEMLNIGGLYIIDDMLPQENWPEGHAEKALKLEKYLEKRSDLKLTKLNWATGIMIAVKV